MTALDRLQRGVALYSQLCWYVRLRWGAAAAVILLSLADWHWLGFYHAHAWMVGVGAAILGYNALLRLLTRPPSEPLAPPRGLLALAWTQILLDLLCLTALTVWTGGLRSPLLGFYVFHMVFASLLLARGTAHAAVMAAALLLTGGLWLTGQWPSAREDKLVFVGWAVTLLTTVCLANSLTWSLRRRGRRLLRQNQRIREISDQLRRQRRAMVQAEKMAAMGQMAAGVAHEIANPLACMDSLLQLAQRKGSPPSSEMVATLREQIGRINLIVRDLTHFAHPAEDHSQVMGADRLVEGALQMVRFDARLRRVALDWRPPVEAPPVCVQPHAIEQVLVNLILNALDAMAETSRPRLEIALDGRPHECLIRVRDNGPGIPPEHMDHLFEPFFTTKPVGKGTGLGLSVSFGLIRGHGGRIEVQSTPGQGATFTIALPLAAEVPAHV